MSVRVPLLGVWIAALVVLSVNGGTLQAQPAAKLTENKIDILKRDGDRLADQGDFQGALQKYTTAYLGVVSRIRGQEFTQPVVPNVYNREQLGKEMLRIMQDEYTDDELELMDASYKAFGLVPASLDCQALITQMLTEEVAGFYDPDSKRMVLIVEDGPTEDPGWLGRLLGAEQAFSKDAQQTTLAHELTHALQDQLYDLNAMEQGIEKDDDMLLAFSALVEGDATLLMFVEMDDTQDVSRMDPAAMRVTFNLMSWMLPLAGGETYRKAPAIFRDSLTFPYFQGMLFALAAAGEGGWQSVHELYSDPPTSSEQILHPAKYFDKAQRDVPQAITIPDLNELLGADWKHLGGNVLGELQTRILLKRVRGGVVAAEGWDGDRYEVFKRNDGQLGLISVSIWDSLQDADQFAEAYRQYRATESAPQPAARAQAKRSADEASTETPPTEPELTEPELTDAPKHVADLPPGSSPNAKTSDDPQLKIVAQTGGEGNTKSDGYIEARDHQVWIVEGFDAEQTQRIVRELKACQVSEKVFPRPVR